MNPRKNINGAGLPGPGQEVWTEQIKETIRQMVFIPRYVQVLRQGDEDAGGSVDPKYKPHGEPLDGRLDNVGSAGGEAKIFGEQINERTTHILSLPPEADAGASDRFEIEGHIWISTSESVRTNQATKQLQVEELHG